MPQKIEYLADPSLHGAPIPAGGGSSTQSWYTLVKYLDQHLNPSNPAFELPDDVRSARLQDGVMRILRQAQLPKDPFLLLLLLDLCQATNVESSGELSKLLAGRVRDARANWWIADGPEVQHLGQMQRPEEILRLVDRNRLALSKENIVDAWDQSIFLSPPLFHRRRLHTFLNRISSDRLTSTPEGQHATRQVDYSLDFVTSTAVQHPADPIILILILKTYLSTSPSVRGQKFFEATIDILPELTQTWTHDYKRAIRSEIMVCTRHDAEVYLAARQWLRLDLEPYLGETLHLWKDILPSPREINGGVIAREDRWEAIKSARSRGKSIFDPGEALDYNRLRPLNSGVASLRPTKQSGARKRVGETEGTFGMRR